MEASEAERMLRALLESAVRHYQAGQHILLCGPTVLCRKTLLTVTPQVDGLMLRAPSIAVLERAGDMAALLCNLKSHSFVFIEDLHRLEQPPCEVLAQAMTNCTIHLGVGRGQSTKWIDLNLPPFTLIGGTSRPPLLTQRLKQSFKQQIWIDDPTDSAPSTKWPIH